LTPAINLLQSNKNPSLLFTGGVTGIIVGFFGRRGKARVFTHPPLIPGAVFNITIAFYPLDMQKGYGK
jgi:hypothetical protein